MSNLYEIFFFFGTGEDIFMCTYSSYMKFQELIHNHRLPILFHPPPPPTSISLYLCTKQLLVYLTVAEMQHLNWTSLFLSGLDLATTLLM